MNYLITRRKTSEINNFMEEYPLTYATQIAEFLKADKNYVRELVKQYKKENNLSSHNFIESKKFFTYLKNQNKCKSSGKQV